MKNLFRISSLVLAYLLLTSCSASKSEKVFDSLNIKVVDVQSWLNLMPGGPGSFHISGKYELPNEMDEKKIFLDRIIVLDDKVEIYSMIAELHYINILLNGKKEFIFTNRHPTKIDPILMKRDSIDLQLVFSINGTLIKKNFNKVSLTRAY
ncbi:MAG: hypothetical protein WAU11_14555 [Ignavibacteriaceae bacterium]